VTIKANYGCSNTGDMVYDTQVNAATCAKISIDDDKGKSHKSLTVTMDTSSCGEKSKSKKFLTTLEAAIKNTFTAHDYKIIKFIKQ